VAVLNEAGFSTAEDWLPIRLAPRHDDGREVDLHPLAISEDGTGILPGFEGVAYRHPPEEITSGQIAGRCAGSRPQCRSGSTTAPSRETSIGPT
jgi:lincosamide nucleotidyltransferase A/C/D/E